MNIEESVEAVKSYRRKVYWIEPQFQRRFMVQMMILASVAVTVTFLVSFAFVFYQDHTQRGTFFYVTDEMGKDPAMFNRTRIIVPVLLLSEAIALVMTGILGFFYSHRLAGPLHRIKVTLAAVNQGQPVGPITLRAKDEFKDLADAINAVTENR